MAHRDHVAWVTGGGRGIGRACAEALAQEGHAVAVTARTTSELDETVRACAAHKARALAVTCDVTDAQAVQRAHARVAKDLGAPDMLVNGAGLARSAPFLKTGADLFESHWRLNVLGVVHCTQAALPAMLERGWGRVVNIASIAGKVGAPYIAAYAASKHAVLGLTRTLAAEYAGKGITVNAVCPGYVDTRMTQDNVRIMAQKTGRPEAELLERIKAMSPQHRLIQPSEVAAAVTYLCRNEAGGVNGQALTMDGGGVQA